MPGNSSETVWSSSNRYIAKVDDSGKVVSGKLTEVWIYATNCKGGNGVRYPVLVMPEKCRIHWITIISEKTP